MEVIQLFSGCGGLDLGFENAGFKVVWANEKDQNIWTTYEKNHPSTTLDKRTIHSIPSSEIPDCVGVIGGPPCQSWSTAGKGRGVDDPRGKLFLEFVRVVEDKKPLFFVAENVRGILAPRHKESFQKIVSSFQRDYDVYVQNLNAVDYGVPQHRDRVFIVGFRKGMNLHYTFLEPLQKQETAKILYDLKDSAQPSNKNYTLGDCCTVPNHEYWLGNFSYIFMSRNRVLSWDKPAFTIQASGRQISLHPDAPRMSRVVKDVMRFDNPESPKLRRLTIRECARLQGFPDEFIFHYNHIGQGYKMVGNAVPVGLGQAIAASIRDVLSVSTENSLPINEKEVVEFGNYYPALQFA